MVQKGEEPRSSETRDPVVKEIRIQKRDQHPYKIIVKIIENENQSISPDEQSYQKIRRSRRKLKTTGKKHTKVNSFRNIK